jgi:hypothetical protein
LISKDELKLSLLCQLCVVLLFKSIVNGFYSQFSLNGNMVLPEICFFYPGTVPDD